MYAQSSYGAVNSERANNNNNTAICLASSKSHTSKELLTHNLFMPKGMMSVAMPRGDAYDVHWPM